MSYNPNLPAGQAAMAASSPVTIANNQSALPVTFTGSTDAATQTTLAAINTKLASGTVIGDVNLGATDNAVLDAAVATLGATTGAAVITDANGTIQQYLRGLVTLDLVDNAVLDTIYTATNTVAGAVSATHMQCDIVGALPAGTAAIGKLAANSGVDIGDVDILSIAAGDNNIGNVDIVTMPGGSQLIFRSIDLDETEEEVKATAAILYGWFIFNAAATTQYVKLYNLTAANTTVGTSTPVMTIPVPAGAAANVSFPGGIAFATALTAAATTGVADADTGAPAANSVVINLFYL